MNQRDFDYIESRMFGDDRLIDARARLGEAGETALADAVGAELRRQADVLRDLRRALLDRWIEQQKEQP